MMMVTNDQRKIFMSAAEDSENENNFTIKRYNYVLKYDSDFYKGKRILDLGCARGFGTNHMKENGAKVVGVDGNEHYIDIAYTRYAPTIFMQSLLWDTRLPKEIFDCVTVVETIEHLDFDERDMTLKEIKRMLKKNGFLYITTPKQRKDPSEFPSGSHFYEYRMDELIHIVQGFGFNCIWKLDIGDTNDVSMALLFQKVNR